MTKPQDQWDGDKSRVGLCGYGGCRYPKTHVVKWPWAAVTMPPEIFFDGTPDQEEIPLRYRRFVCADHAHRMTETSRRDGTDVRAYRYRVVARTRSA